MVAFVEQGDFYDWEKVILDLGEDASVWILDSCGWRVSCVGGLGREEKDCDGNNGEVWIDLHRH